MEWQDSQGSNASVNEGGGLILHASTRFYAQPSIDDYVDQTQLVRGNSFLDARQHAANECMLLGAGCSSFGKLSRDHTVFTSIVSVLVPDRIPTCPTSNLEQRVL
jgi:hypothetical protein